MKELSFVANSIATDDAYYLHFSDRHHDPTTYMVMQGQRYSNLFISVKSGQCIYSGSGRIETNLGTNFVIFNMSPELASEIGGLTRVTAEFNVDRAKYEAICRRLWEILGYRQDGGTEAQQGHERGRL